MRVALRGDADDVIHPIGTHSYEPPRLSRSFEPAGIIHRRDWPVTAAIRSKSAS